LRFSAKVIWRQLRGSCDVVFFDHVGLARVQSLIPRFLRRPYGVFLHSIEAWAPLNRNRLKTLANAKLRIANSNYTAARVAAAHPEIGEIHVCHLTLGLGVSKLDRLGGSIQQNLVGQIRDKSVLIVGRMMREESYKGHDRLIHAWPLVLKSVPDAQLVIVGGGDDVTRLKMLAEQLNAAGNILFTGRVSDETLDAIYAKSSVFAMPSRAEGFGMVYLEAMAHRLACIGSVHDAAREFIVNEETGFLVDQDDTPCLAAKIVLLLTDSTLRDRLGHRGFERLQAHFSFQRFEDRVAELLSQLRS
jgi:glycosyltransferase involved in cell wall biosynthesis